MLSLTSISGQSGLSYFASAYNIPAAKTSRRALYSSLVEDLASSPSQSGDIILFQIHFVCYYLSDTLCIRRGWKKLDHCIKVDGSIGYYMLLE